MAVKEKLTASESAYRQASEIIDREWMAIGFTKEELIREEQLAIIFDNLVSSGRTVEDIRKEWEDKTTEDILREYSSVL